MADNRQVTLTGPLADTFSVIRVSGEEALGRLYEIAVDLLAADGELDFGDVLGQPLGVRIALPGGGERFFHGLVTRFGQTGGEGRYAAYRAVLRPWAWYLTRAADCRIFQEQTIPDIVKAVFREHGFSDFEESLSGDYSPHTYCVQYRETDFNFVCRLMEEEGITFFFRHEEDRHTLVLADGLSAYSTVSGYEEIPFYPPGNEQRRERDHISEWLLDQEIQTELYALRDYDFEKPKANLDAKASIQRNHGADSFEVYDYPGFYKEKSDGDTLAEIRVEEQQTRFETLHGQGDARGIAPGFLFSLTNHPRADQNREVLVTQARYDLDAGQYETEGGSGAVSMHCAFTAVPSDQAFRPARVTPKPVVQGPHTATVVGPSGETVWTDQYGRVKVQFHWDREGQRDENSSCWLRVSQNWAGKEWGGMFIPHVGHEVIVSFLEGDPDQPIITGRVYNADNMPPLGLPDNRYKSIIRDHYGNEIIMDGTPGSEHMTLYSPSHQSKMSLGESIKRVTLSNDWELAYGDKLSLFVGNSHSGTVGNATSHTVGHSFVLTLGMKESVQFGTDVGVFVGAKAAVSVGPELAVNLSTKYSVGFSREFKYLKGSYQRQTSGNIVHDSDKKVIVAGGKQDHTILQSDDTEIVMAYGDKAVDRSVSEKWAHIAAATAAASTATAAALGVAAAMSNKSRLETERQAQVQTTGDANAQPEFNSFDDYVNFEGPLGGTAVGFGALAAAAMLAQAFAGKDQPEPAHATTHAQVAVRKDEVDMYAGSDQAGSITVQPKEIRVMVDGNIILFTGTKGDVVINKLMKVSKKSKMVKIMSGKIDHKYLKVMG